MKYCTNAIPILVSSVLFSGCSLQDYWQDAGNYFYASQPAIDSTKICVNHHFHRPSAFADDFTEAISNEITYFYSFGSKDSRQADESYAQISPYLFNEKTEIARVPAINNNNWVGAARWALSLEEIGLESNPDMIVASYDYFLDLDESEFNHQLMNHGESPQLFYEVLSSSEFKDEISFIGDTTYRTGIEKIPAIMINKSYIVYPSDYNDQRDAWIVASLLLSSPLDIPQKCL